MLQNFAGRCGLYAAFAFVFSNFPLLAQNQAFTGPASQSISSARYAVTGTVVNSVTGEPIRRALVQISLGRIQSVLTDANGQFEFKDLPAGSTGVDAQKPGFFEQRELSDAQTGLTTVAIGPNPQSLVLKLIPEGVISGHIQSANGEAIENLTVRVYRSQIVDGRMRWMPTGGGSTNADGEFRIAELKPGTYHLEAGPSGFSPEAVLSAKVRDAYPALLYPGVDDLNAATPLEIAPGQHVNADFSMKPVQFFKVSGTIQGIAPASTNLFLLDKLGTALPVEEQVDVATGQFHAKVPAGQHTLQVAAWGEGGVQLSGEVPLVVNSEINGVKIALAPESEIPVYVKAEATHPTSLKSGLHPRFTLTSSEEMYPQVHAAMEQNPGSARMSLPNVSPGTYFSDIKVNAPWYVSSAQCGSLDLLRNELTVSAGVQTPAIEIVLRDDAARLTAHINSASSTTRTFVLLLADTGLFHDETVLGDTATFDNLAPGSYSVFAFDRVDIEYRNPMVLQQYASRAAHITLQPEARQELNLDLIQAAE